jgi:flagellin
MALTVNTNVASLTAQRQLGGSQSMMSTSLERLSSGLRINSAKDDAAGLAISERFTAQVRGLNQGVRNANDGISLVQTAEGALKEVSSNLQRIRELAVQSANATNSDTDRLALQDEVAQLVAEIDRVTANTKFNGTALLDGTFTDKAFQIGADAGETITIASIDSARAADIGGSFAAALTATQTSAVNSTAIATGALFMNGIAVSASTSDGVSTDGDTASALSKANALNAVSSQTGVSVTASTDLTSGASAAQTAAATAGFILNDVTVTFSAVTAASAANVTAAVTAINNFTSLTGVTASLSGGSSASATLTLTSSDGRNIEIKNSSSTSGNAIVGLTTGTTYGKLAFTSTSQYGIQATNSSASTVFSTDRTVDSTDDATTGALLGYTGGDNGGLDEDATGSGVSLSGLSVNSVANATAAITSIDNALQTVNDTRATLGAYQNRFNSVVNNLQTTSENLSASRSRIVDADFAAETAQMTKAQILQQSGIAMLAQANSIPQNVLALLQ